MNKKLNPFVSIWKSPRETVRSVLVHKGFWAIAFLSFFGAWASALFASLNAENSQIDDEVSFTQPSLPMEFAISIISGIASVLIGCAFIALLYWAIGKLLFKGQGTYMDLYKGSMLTAFPFYIALPFILAFLILYPNEFYNNDLNFNGVTMFLYAVVVVLGLIGSIYAFVVTIVMISEIHKISKWKAFFTMFIPTFILFIIIMVIVVVLFIGLAAIGG